MPRYSTFSTLIDDLRCVDIKDLRRWGYLRKGRRMSGTMTWSRNGIQTSSISIGTKINNTPKLLLSYSVDGEPIKYEITLVEVSSNLGKGQYFMFLCPFTLKRCRKLHLINGKFMHRSALINSMYESQTQPKSYRSIKGIFEPYVLQDKYFEEIHSKHFTAHYKGKPTKRYKWLMQKLQRADQMSLERYESILVFGK